MQAISDKINNKINFKKSLLNLSLCLVWILTHSLTVGVLWSCRHAHQHQRDPEGEEPEAVSPQPALPGPESDPPHQPQPLPVCASEPGAQAGGRRSEPERQHLLQPPAAAHRSVSRPSSL